jgi:hypothetical protein
MARPALTHDTPWGPNNCIVCRYWHRAAAKQMPYGSLGEYVIGPTLLKPTECCPEHEPDLAVALLRVEGTDEQ